MRGQEVQGWQSQSGVQQRKDSLLFGNEDLRLGRVWERMLEYGKGFSSMGIVVVVIAVMLLILESKELAKILVLSNSSHERKKL